MKKYLFLIILSSINFSITYLHASTKELTNVLYQSHEDYKILNIEQDEQTFCIYLTTPHLAFSDTDKELVTFSIRTENGCFNANSYTILDCSDITDIKCQRSLLIIRFNGYINDLHPIDLTIFKHKKPIAVFYGIGIDRRCTKTVTEELDKDFINPDNFKDGKIIIKGKIRNYTKSNNTFIAYIKNFIPYNNPDNRKIITEINPDGTFSMEYRVQSPTWNSIWIKTGSGPVEIPFIAIPNDTVKFIVDNIDQITPNITYLYPKGKEYERLLLHSPIYNQITPFEYDNNKLNYSDFITEKFEDELNTNKYISAQYGLSPKEFRILNTRSRINYVFNMTMQQLLNESKSSADNSEGNSSTLCYTDYQYLKTLKTCDIDYLVNTEYYNFIDHFLNTQLAQSATINAPKNEDNSIDYSKLAKSIQQVTEIETQKDIVFQGVLATLPHQKQYLTDKHTLKHINKESRKMQASPYIAYATQVYKYTQNDITPYQEINTFSEKSILQQLINKHSDKIIQLVFLPLDEDPYEMIEISKKLGNILIDFRNKKMKVIFIGRNGQTTKDFMEKVLPHEECLLLNPHEYTIMFAELGNISAPKTETIIPNKLKLKIPLDINNETSFRHRLRNELKLNNDDTQTFENDENKSNL